MTNKHTPGPWHVDEDSHESSIFVSSENYGIADCGPLTGKVANANARLIAKAPEMANVLQNVVLYLRRQGPPPMGLSDEVIATMAERVLSEAGVL